MQVRLGTTSNWSRITFLVTPGTRFKEGKDKALALYAFIAEVDDDVGDLVASETRQRTKRKILLDRNPRSDVVH